jgi:hypothetical protein
MLSWELTNLVYVMMEIFNSNYQAMKGHLKIIYLVIAWKMLKVCTFIRSQQGITALIYFVFLFFVSILKIHVLHTETGGSGFAS